MRRWFKPWGWIYLPVSIIGGFLTGICFVLILWAFLVVDRTSHSVSDTLIGVFPWAWIAVATLLWIAGKTSE